MANTTNPESWAAQERLRFVERSLWWRGQVQRRDLGETFGISLAQASSDLQRYLEINPLAARYDLKAKTYWGEPHMECRFHSPRLEEALALFLGGAGGTGLLPLPLAHSDSARLGPDRIAIVELPMRIAPPQVQRAAFLATLRGLRLRIDYGSLTGRKAPGWRWIAPHAFAHDGYRWHLRAWCEENEGYRDFVLSRIRETEWPSARPVDDLPRDEDWETYEELTLVANPESPEDQRKAVESDYGMKAGKLRITVRRAMRDYTLNHLHLSNRKGKKAPWLREVTS
ncbi:MAG: WYL domain-containing protein [Verrucomicrobiae bacterium]|nr:WYL domain-containing protein [Verrucomicrobiae bacterium]MCB1085713.1 WYL domain-containing protein [Verrucomicrobiae bacterium]MCB1092181.1 WYL domain-containing protein [Verrucomicrobiae bacterium]